MDTSVANLSISISLDNLDILIEGLGTLPTQRAGFLFVSLVQGRAEHIAKMQSAPAIEFPEIITQPELPPGDIAEMVMN